MATINYDGVELGQLVLNQEGTNIVLLRRYRLTDSDVIVERLKPGKVAETIAIASIPANVLSALQTIDVWTRDKALAQEGLPIP